MKKQNNILIATGIYPPAVGGPATYAKELEGVWKDQGYKVVVKRYSLEYYLPIGIRHVYFLLKSLYSIWRADFILVLDTFSVALPVALGCKLLGKKFVIRTGGDFLWESYVERTKKKILFKDFYNTQMGNFTRKEKLVFRATIWILKQADVVIFSTDWQRSVWSKPYNILAMKTKVVENYYGDIEGGYEPKSKVFVGATRDLVWKNIDILQRVFENPAIKNSEARLDIQTSDRDRFISRIKDSYGVILVSLGDISPNMIMDAIAYAKPFIVTSEIGIYDRIKDIGIFVDPLDERSILEKVLWLMNDGNYNTQVEKIRSFKFRHSWMEIANEIISHD